MLLKISKKVNGSEFSWTRGPKLISVLNQFVNIIHQGT